MYILLIQSDEALGSNMPRMLANNGFQFDVAEDEEDGVELAKLTSYDLILLEYDVAGASAFETLRKLRRGRLLAPVMVVSKTTNLDSMVQLLELGAEDHIAKPFHPLELIARIHAIVRRWNGHADQHLTVGDVVLNLTNRSITVAGISVSFTKTEFKLLELLALRKETIISRDTILSHLYNGPDEPVCKIIDVYLCKIRRKLSPSRTTAISTVWGQGYSIHLLESEAVRVAA